MTAIATAKSLRLRLRPDVRDGTPFCAGNRCEQLRNERLKIGEAIGSCAQYDDRDSKCRKMLLEGEIPIDGDEYVELFRGQGKQLAVLDPDHPI